MLRDFLAELDFLADELLNFVPHDEQRTGQIAFLSP
jgi:hypothetical protein